MLICCFYGLVIFYLLYLFFRFLPESPKWLLSQGRKTQAWATMTKLVPSAVYANIDNGNQDVIEIGKVCYL